MAIRLSTALAHSAACSSCAAVHEVKYSSGSCCIWLKTGPRPTGSLKSGNWIHEVKHQLGPSNGTPKMFMTVNVLHKRNQIKETSEVPNRLSHMHALSDQAFFLSSFFLSHCVLIYSNRMILHPDHINQVSLEATAEEQEEGTGGGGWTREQHPHSDGNGSLFLSPTV